MLRLEALVDAGADCLYPVRVQSSDEAVRTLTAALPLPVNITANPGKDSLTALRALGVGRITFGPYFQSVVRRRASELLADWTPTRPTCGGAATGVA